MGALVVERLQEEAQELLSVLLVTALIRVRSEPTNEKTEILPSCWQIVEVAL